MSRPSRGLSTVTEGSLTKPFFSCSQDPVKTPKMHAYGGAFRAVEGSDFESSRTPHVTRVKLTSCLSLAAICLGDRICEDRDGLRWKCLSHPAGQRRVSNRPRDGYGTQTKPLTLRHGRASHGIVKIPSAPPRVNPNQEVPV
jgi:hypothetical protein